jgi:tRNA threonylcarbamoyladenosine biosynthesis protein TsaE
MSFDVTHSERETMSLGNSFAHRLKPGDVVAIYGELGTGKTRFIQGVCKGLGVNQHVASPTFTIVNEYDFPGGRVYHFDLYRVNSSHEIRDIGFEEYLVDEGICLIEWADRVQALLPERRYEVRMALGARENERAIAIEEVAVYDSAESKTRRGVMP